jgi:large subunit ribosomal protein L23
VPEFHPSDVLVVPVITERAMEKAHAGKYTFVICEGATKVDVKRAVHELFKVDALDVNIVNLPRKAKTAGRHRFFKPRKRKAIVTLKAGQTIPDILNAV